MAQIGITTDAAIQLASQDVARRAARIAVGRLTLPDDRMRAQLGRNLTVHAAEVRQRAIGEIAGAAEPRLPPLTSKMPMSVLGILGRTAVLGFSLVGIGLGVAAAGMAFAG